MDDQGGSERGAGSFSSDVARPVRDRALSPDMLGSVTSELVTRLVRRIPVATAPRLLQPTEPEQIEAFCNALISSDAAQARAFFDTLRADGHSPDRLCLGFIASAVLPEGMLDLLAQFIQYLVGLCDLPSLNDFC